MYSYHSGPVIILLQMLFYTLHVSFCSDGFETIFWFGFLSDPSCLQDSFFRLHSSTLDIGKIYIFIYCLLLILFDCYWKIFNRYILSSLPSSFTNSWNIFLPLMRKHFFQFLYLYMCEWCTSSLQLSSPFSDFFFHRSQISTENIPSYIDYTFQNLWNTWIYLWW